MPKRSNVVGSLWINYKEDYETGKRSAYFTGYVDLGMLGQVKIAVFKNTYKKEGTHPDYNIVLSQPEPQKKDEPVGDDSDVPF
jgi:hypothetical protein